VPTRKRRRFARCGLGLFTLFGGLTIAACDAPPPIQQPPPAVVGVIEVQPRALALDLEYPAQLRGVREVEVRARVSGILLERRYDEGARVEAGDILFRIDPEPFRAAVARARAELQVQEANLGQARRERDRIVPLYEQNLASLRDRDNALASFEGAEAAVAAARAALRTAELELSYTDVRAPIAGLTSREVRSEGSLVTAGSDSSLLTYIVQEDRLYVDLSVSDGEAELVRAAVDAGGAVAVQVTNAEGHPIGAPAPIEFISPRIDDATGTVAIRAVLENPGGIVPGRIVRAHVKGVDIANALVIPKRAVVYGAMGPYVWTVDGGGMVTPTPVTLGAFAGNDVVVARGLAAGNRVVVEGVLKVIPGFPVTAEPIAAEPAEGSAP
jgi:membrane fusion protein (multidrug efflux system)